MFLPGVIQDFNPFGQRPAGGGGQTDFPRYAKQGDLGSPFLGCYTVFVPGSPVETSGCCS